MGSCHTCDAQSEIPPPTPQWGRRMTSEDIRARSSTASSSCSDSAGYSSPSHPPLLKTLSADTILDREVYELAGSGAWSYAESKGSSSSSGELSFPCDCKMVVGSEVILAPGYINCLDASQGNLSPNQVGTVGEIEDGMVCVYTPGDSWWYGESALHIKCSTRCAASTHRLRSPSYSTQKRCFRQACQASICVANLAAARWNHRVSSLCATTLQPG